jgi:cysteine-rich repeat protein
MKNQIVLRALFALGLSTAACEESRVADLNQGDQTQDASTSLAPDTGPSPVADAGVMGQPDAQVIMAGAVELNTATLDFGDVVVTSTQTRILTIRNPQSNPVRVSLSEPSGRNADRFSQSIGVSHENGIFELAPGQTIEVEISVSPNELGQLFASVALDSCMGTCPVAITLEAKGVATGVYCPEMFDVGTVNPGHCISGAVVCENRGNITELITAVDLNPNSDSQFTFTMPALPVQFTAGATLAFNIEYCPNAIEENTGELLVLTFEPTELEHAIQLVGHGGGPDISCAPSAINFGVAGLGDTLRADVQCTNSGNTDLTVGAAFGTRGSFNLASGPTTIAPGATENFMLEVSHATAASLMDVFIISSDDIDTPRIEIPLSAEFVEAQICDASVSPANFDFGLVAVGRSQRVSLSIENNGSDICILQAVSLAMGSGVEFAFDNPPASGTAVASGASLPFDVVFTPNSAASSVAIVQVSFANPMSVDLTTNLSGSGGDLNLITNPTSLDFGPTPTGCAAPLSRQLELTNVGSGALNILSVAVVGTSSAAFTVRGMPASGMASLDRLETLTLSIEFDPSAAGNYSGQLRISVDGQASPTLVLLSGSAAVQASRTDVFDFSSPQADVLFVVDDSCSMTTEQEALADDFSTFSDTLLSRGVDLHFAVVTTDMTDLARQGRMIGMPAYLTHNSMNLSDEMETRLQPGTSGSGSEMGILAALTAVTPPLSAAENMGFLRTDADLVIVMMSDEDDQSDDQLLGGSIQDAVNTLESAAENGELSISAISGPALGRCNGPYGQARTAGRYHEVVTRTQNGLALSLCTDIGNSLQTLADHLFGGPAFQLQAEPIESTIVVEVNGTAVSSSNMGATVWTYDAVTTSVVFAAGQVPANGAQIRITYNPYCLSATCGDGTNDPNEECDDGNMSNDDACTAGCRTAFCGDAFVYAGQEECDDANSDNTDDCVAGCHDAVCGDGYVQDGVESCDDGNTMGGDACPANCVFPGYNVGQRTSHTYAELDPASSTPLNPADGMGGMNSDDGIETIQLPFSFNYYGVSTSSITVSINGLIIMGGFNYQNTANNQSIPETSAPNGIVAVWWDDLHLLENNMTYDSGLSYEIQGNAPNRSVVVQWKNVRHFRHNNMAFRRWNFQVAIDEASSEIHLRYGETEYVPQVNVVPYAASVGFENHDGSDGEEVLSCSPGCDGRPPNRSGDFPEAQSITITPR